jgi:UDP:flavonoid glycosyltransferase YjiC (YdhE family)
MSHACHARGVARVIDTEPVSTTDLDDALRSVTADPRYRSAAREVAGEIAATSGPDQIAQLLQTRCQTGLLQTVASR